MKINNSHLLLLCLYPLACSSPSSGPDETEGTGGVPSSSGGALTGSGGFVIDETGGSAAGGLAALGSGGAPNSGGTAAGGTTSGGAAAAGGSVGDLTEVADALDGLRVDDACAGTPTVSVGATCDHALLTGPGALLSNEVSLGGVLGQTYDVTLRVRGVLEPTNIVGGMSSSDTTTFSYMGSDWLNVPLTVGGAVLPDDSDYAQWSIRVAHPAQEFFLNNYGAVGHYVFALDYEVTIPMAAQTTVELRATDSNERLILNYENYQLDGLAGSMNHGQFVEISVVAVKLNGE